MTLIFERAWRFLGKRLEMWELVGRFTMNSLELGHHAASNHAEFRGGF